MEFTVLNQTEILNLPSVQWNFNDLKKYALEKAEEYKGIAYTEDDVKAMKTDRADINRFINAIEDERKQKKKEFMKPYDAFEAQVKEVLKPLREAEALIKKGLEEIEKKWAEDRLRSIMEIYDRLADDQIKAVYTQDDIKAFDWFFKKATTLKKIEEYFKEYFDSVRSDIKEIMELPEKYRAYALNAYKSNNRNLSYTLSEVRKIQEQEKAIEEIKGKGEEPNATTENQAAGSGGDTQGENPVSVPEPILTLDFRVHGTRTQILALRDYMKANNIVFERVV